ncbi:hypothetical protein ACFS5N_04740 [Mucilaginibacter ximonensis]|uniref:Uncharacterized protein n=1 Tax=Mucilaginibacter ximonensis TaxID=538021 RepID=A0ABW5Y8Z1_9SPHI
MLSGKTDAELMPEADYLGQDNPGALTSVMPILAIVSKLIPLLAKTSNKKNNEI